MSNLTKELVKRGDIYRHYKGEKVGITKVEDDIVYYTDLETGEQHKKVYDEFIGKAISGAKRFVYLEHVSM